MDKMNKAFEKVKTMVGMEVEDEQQTAALEESNSFAFMDEFNQNCILSTKQVFLLLWNLLSILLHLFCLVTEKIITIN